MNFRKVLLCFVGFVVVGCTEQGTVMPAGEMMPVTATTMPIAAVTEMPDTVGDGCPAASAETVALANQLAQADWETVYEASEALVARGEESIPALIALLERDEYVKLVNTADLLIYPGASRFHGRDGWVIFYELDWLTMRTGWVLERITFQDFGFLRSSFLTSDSSNVDAETMQETRRTAAEQARRWWAENCSSWSRLDGLKEGLQGDNPYHVRLTFEWLYYLRSHPEAAAAVGYSETVEREEITPLLRRLTESENAEIAELARGALK